MRNTKPTAALLTIDPQQAGGVLTHAKAAAKLLQLSGFQVEVFYTRSRPGPSTAQGTVAFDVPVREMPPIPIPFAWTVSPLLFGRAMKEHDLRLAVSGSCHVAFSLAVRKKPFLVWFAALWGDELVQQSAAGDRHAKRVIRHPIVWPLLRAQERFVLRRASRIIANSPHTAQRIRAELPDVSNRVTSIMIPVDARYFEPDFSQKGDGPFGRYILLVGRLSDRRKNVPLAIEAFTRVKATDPNLRFVIAGDEPTAPLRDLVARLNLESSVVFPGKVSREDLRRLYQGAQLLVLSSLQEGLGLVVLEAMACGTPVVSTRCGGPEDILKGNQDVGRLVPTEEPALLANAISDLLSDCARLTKMSYRCVELVNEHHSFASAKQQLSRELTTCYPYLVP